MNVSDAEITEMINQMDYHNNKKINYSEFLAATIDVQGNLSKLNRNQMLGNISFDDTLTGIFCLTTSTAKNLSL